MRGRGARLGCAPVAAASGGLDWACWHAAPRDAPLCKPAQLHPHSILLWLFCSHPGKLFELDGWKWVEGAARAGTLHLIGLLSDGGVHSRCACWWPAGWLDAHARVAIGVWEPGGPHVGMQCRRAAFSARASRTTPHLHHAARLPPTHLPHRSYDQLMLLMEGAIRQGVKRIRLHVLSGAPCRAALLRSWRAAPHRMRPASLAALSPLPHPVLPAHSPSASAPALRPARPADGRDVNDDTAVAWVRRLDGDARQLSERHGADVRVASGGGRMAVTMDRCERCPALRLLCCVWVDGGVVRGGGRMAVTMDRCECRTWVGGRQARARRWAPACLRGPLACLAAAPLPTFLPTCSPVGHPPTHLRADESDWRVVQRGYCAHVLGEAPHTFTDPVEAVKALKKGNSVSGGRAVGGLCSCCCVLSRARLPQRWHGGGRSFLLLPASKGEGAGEAARAEGGWATERSAPAGLPYR